MRGSGLVVGLLAICLGTGGQGQATVQGASCRGLHAGITVERSHISAGDQGLQVSLLLFNDSDETVDVDAGSWELLIDGVAVKNNRMLFGNGPRPSGGFRRLEPGKTYGFGWSLRATDYIPEKRVYTVGWRGSKFVSPVVRVMGGILP